MIISGGGQLFLLSKSFRSLFHIQNDLVNTKSHILFNTHDQIFTFAIRNTKGQLKLDKSRE